MRVKHKKSPLFCFQSEQGQKNEHSDSFESYLPCSYLEGSHPSFAEFISAMRYGHFSGFLRPIGYGSVPADVAMRSERCGVIARKLNPHRVFISVPSAVKFIYKLYLHKSYSIVSGTYTPHFKHFTNIQSDCSSGGGLPRLHISVLLRAGTLPILPFVHLGHNNVLLPFTVVVSSFTTIIKLPPFYLYIRNIANTKGKKTRCF